MARPHHYLSPGGQLVLGIAAIAFGVLGFLTFRFGNEVNHCTYRLAVSLQIVGGLLAAIGTLFVWQLSGRQRVWLWLAAAIISAALITGLITTDPPDHSVVGYCL